MSLSPRPAEQAAAVVEGPDQLTVTVGITWCTYVRFCRIRQRFFASYILGPECRGGPFSSIDRSLDPKGRMGKKGHWVPLSLSLFLNPHKIILISFWLSLSRFSAVILLSTNSDLFKRPTHRHRGTKAGRPLTDFDSMLLFLEIKVLGVYFLSFFT